MTATIFFLFVPKLPAEVYYYFAMVTVFLCELCSLKCSVSGESASDESLTEPCEKPMLVDFTEVPSIFAIDGKGSAMYAPDSEETCSLKVRL